MASFHFLKIKQFLFIPPCSEAFRAPAAKPLLLQEFPGTAKPFTLQTFLFLVMARRRGGGGNKWVLRKILRKKKKKK